MAEEPLPPPPLALLSTLTDQLILDSGASAILLRQSALSRLLPFFTASPLPPLSFKTPTKALLQATTGGHLRFPLLPHDVPCYVLPDSELSHSLLSVSALLGPHGSVTFTPTSATFTSPASPTPYLSGSKLPSDTLWTLLLPTSPAPIATGACLMSSPPVTEPDPTTTLTALAARTVPAIRNLDDAGFVAYQHRCFGSPSISTLVGALRRGWIRIRRFTSRLVLRNPPLSIHTAFGHLDAQAKNVATTRISPPHVLAITRSHASPPLHHHRRFFLA